MISDTGLRSGIVVVTPPVLDLAASLSEGPKPTRIQALVAETAIEALTQAVLYRLTGGNEIGFDPAIESLGIEVEQDELTRNEIYFGKRVNTLRIRASR